MRIRGYFNFNHVKKIINGKRLYLGIALAAAIHVLGFTAYYMLFRNNKNDIAHIRTEKIGVTDNTPLQTFEHRDIINGGIDVNDQNDTISHKDIFARREISPADKIKAKKLLNASIKSARQAWENYNRNGEVDFDYARFFIDMDYAQYLVSEYRLADIKAEKEPDELINIYSSIRSGIVSELEMDDNLSNLEKLNILRRHLAPYLRKYYRPQAFLSLALENGSANCQAQTKLVLSLLNDLREYFKGITPYVQLFRDHVQAILYDEESKTFVDIIGGKRYEEVPYHANLFHPFVLIGGYLNKYGRAYDFSSEKLIVYRDETNEGQGQDYLIPLRELDFGKTYIIEDEELPWYRDSTPPVMDEINISEEIDWIVYPPPLPPPPPHPRAMRIRI